MPARKPLLSPDAAAFVRGSDPAPAAAAPKAKQAPAAPAAADDAEPRVRFTVDLPKGLHKRLKLAALDRDLPMTDLARQALTEWLDHQV